MRENDGDHPSGNAGADDREQSRGAAKSRDPGKRSFDFAGEIETSYRKLRAIAAACADHPQHAEDILQEAAMTALGKQDQFRPGTNFTAWMARFVRNIAANQTRARRRRRTRTLEPEVLETVSRDPESPAPLKLQRDGQLPADQGVFDDRLVEALRTLGPDARACLLLRTVEGLSYREIAQTLKIPEGTAMSHVHRSRQALRRHLADRTRGLEPTDEKTP